MRGKLLFILGGVALAALIGTIIFFSSYSYDKITFGQELLPYENTESLSIIVTAEVDGSDMYIIPQNRVSLIEAISRGDGKRKKVSSPYEGEGDTLKVVFNQDIEITISNDPDRGIDQNVAGANDLAYITYNNIKEETEKYYTLEGLATYKNVHDLLTQDVGNIPITEFTGDEAAIRSITEDNWKKIGEKGFHVFLSNESSEFIQKKMKKFGQMFLSSQARMKNEGAFKSVEAISVYGYASMGSDYALVLGDAVFEKGWETFLMIYDSDGNLIDCTVK